MPQSSMQISDADLPALFRAADEASLDAQAAYLRLIRLDISLVLVAALLGSLSTDDEAVQRSIAILSAIVLGFSLGVSGILATRRFDRAWYAGRAIAESIKTLAWRYMTGAEPYRPHLDDREADSRFGADVRAVLADRPEAAAALAGSDPGATPEITGAMRTLRKLGVTARHRVSVGAD